MTERNGRSGRKSSKPPGKPVDTWTPAPRPASPRPAFDRASKGRLTLDFSGPLLPLPGEARESVASPSEPALPGFDARGEGLAREEFMEDAWTSDRAARVAPATAQGAAAQAARRRSSSPKVRVALGSEHDGDALGLVDRSHPIAPEIDLAGEMSDRFALGDFTGALRAAELVLGKNPDDADAQRCARSSRERLEQLYTSRLGRLELVPALALAERDIRWLGLDHRAAFLLSRIDGAHSVEELVDVSGMPRLETLKTLVELLEQRAIHFPDRG